MEGLGDTLTIFGTHFSLDSASIKAIINSQRLRIIHLTEDRTVCTISQNTGTGPVQVNMNGITYSYGGSDFTYVPEVIVTTLAGKGVVGNTDGQAMQAYFYCPWDIQADSNGDLYIAGYL